MFGTFKLVTTLNIQSVTNLTKRARHCLIIRKHNFFIRLSKLLYFNTKRNCLELSNWNSLFTLHTINQGKSKTPSFLWRLKFYGKLYISVDMYLRSELCRTAVIVYRRRWHSFELIRRPNCLLRPSRDGN